MEIITHLLDGFGLAFSYENLMYCAIGCFVGTLIGLLPGLGPISTISILLPLTYHIPTAGSIIMLVGVYYGAQYGDSVSAITMKIPHASSIAMCIDGHKMHQQGKTGLALFTAGISSFIGGTVAFIIVVTFAPWLSSVAFYFGAPEYVMLMLMGFLCVGLITTGSTLNGFAMALIGVLLGIVGTDVSSGITRFTLGVSSLYDGIGVISVAIGCFGIAEIVHNLDIKNKQTPFVGSIHLMPTKAELKRILPSALRGSFVGSLMGVVPGGGTIMAQFSAYAVDKKVSKYKDEIGNGAIEGVASPAAADEAAARTSFIPLMSLGIPENPVMALIMSALMLKGINPGPQMLETHADLFWSVVASMWIGNVFLVILNVPLVKYWLSVFKIPYSVMLPCILFFCAFGTYSVNHNVNDIYVTAFFGVLGYIFLKSGLEAAPLMMGFILGPALEENFRRSLMISRGDFTIFVARPLSGVLFAIIVFIIMYSIKNFLQKENNDSFTNSTVLR